MKFPNPEFSHKSCRLQSVNFVVVFQAFLTVIGSSEMSQKTDLDRRLLIEFTKASKEARGTEIRSLKIVARSIRLQVSIYFVYHVQNCFSAALFRRRL